MYKHLLLLYFLIENKFLDTNCKQQPKKRFGFSPEALGRDAMIQFMNYAYEKMGRVKCVTFVSDDYLGYMVGSLGECPLKIGFCSSYKYQIHYEGGNMSEPEPVTISLKAGYDRRCGGYVILLSEQNHILQFLHEGDVEKTVNTRARFLIWYEGNDKKFEADNIWEKIPNVILFHSKPKRRESGFLFTVRELKWPIPLTSAEQRVRVIEFWGHENTDQDSRQIWFYDKTVDLKNTTLRIVVVEHPPGVIKYTDANGNVDYAGSEIQIVKSLAKIMKFSYEFYDADPRTKWGGQETANESRGAWGRQFYGAVSRLIYGEADMGIGSFFILKHYLNHIDMSVPVEVACTSFLTPNPLPRPRYLALILPFDFQLWVLVITIALFFGPLILYIFSAHPLHRTEFGVFRTRDQVILTSFRLMSQVSFDIWPKFWPIRLYIGWYWVFWFLLTSGYRAAMVSFLTIPLYEDPIDTIQDLSKSNLRIGGWGEELQRIFFQHLQINSDNQERNDILENKYELLSDLDEGISRVAEGGFALYENVRFLKFTRMTRNLSSLGSPTMRVMKQCVVPVHIGFAYQKNSAITWTVDRYIRLFQESGLTKRWAQRLILLTREHRRNNQEEQNVAEGGESSDGVGSHSKSREQRVLRIQDLQGVVYLLFFGLGVSLLTFCCEILHSRTKIRKVQIQADFLQSMINKSMKKRKERKEKKVYLVDVRVRKKKKVKRPMKPPPFPYVE